MTLDAREQNTAADGGAAGASLPHDPVAYRRVGILSSAKRDPATSESTYFINASGSEVLEFGEKEYFLWRLLDGTNSLSDIAAKFKERFDITLTPEQFGSFVDQLVACGAVEALGSREPVPPPPQAVPLIAPTSEPREVALPVSEAPRRWVIPLLDPSILLRALDTLCGPFRFFRWLLLPALAAILIWFALEPSAMTANIPALDRLHALGVVALALAIVGIVPPLGNAVTASFFGYETRGCGIGFRGYLVPCLAFDDRDWRQMVSRHVLTVLGAPCLVRLALFIGAAGAWLALRDTGDWAPALALVVAILALLSFLASTAPFLPTQGRRWLATAFGYADLRASGAAYWPQIATLSIFWFAVLAGALSVAAAAVLQAYHPAWYDPETTPMLRSGGLWLLATSAVVTPLYLRGMLNRHGTLQPSYAYADGRPEALDPGQPLDRELRQSRMLVAEAVRPGRRQTAERWPASTSIVIWAILLGCAVAVAFVAYPYEAGGYFTMLPHDSRQLNARVQGELTEILVNEGDEVQPGQILGILSDWQQKYNLTLAKAQLQKAEADLQHLLESPRPEDVELARKQYEAAMARLPYDKAQFDRYAALVANDNVSRSNYDQVLSQYQQDQAAAEVARANYDQVRAPPTQAQIDAARAQVRQYTATLAFAEDELERTRIRATGYGTLVTQNPMLLRGKSFAQGAPVFTIEDHKVLQADVQVSETDIDNVRLGGLVRLRFWGMPEKTFVGKAIAIAPAGQTPSSASPQTPQTGTTNIIRVRALVPNTDGLLYPNTDGYAKIAGANMPTWRAFGQVLERFLLVEIWSWVP
jgi:putative peptide zinc metalloprotease protein